MKTIRAQHLRDYDFSDMERQLRDVFWSILFKPTLEVINKFNPAARGAVAQIRNAGEDPLREALSTGRIQYQDGTFSGEFSATIGNALRSVGARWDKRSKVYRLDAGRVPAWIKSEATNYQSKARAAHTLLMQKLHEMQDNLDAAVREYRVDALRTINRIEGGFMDVAKEIAIQPTLSDDSKQRLADDYSRNMELWVNDFSKKEILSLRQIVERNAQEGYRFDKLVKGIKGRYGVSTSKAKFLARQETSLFMSKYRSERFQQAGVRKYKWSTSHDARVRHDHRELNGTIQLYSSPPIVDRLTGRRGNPGEDYNCRCVDMPVLEAA